MRNALIEDERCREGLTRTTKDQASGHGTGYHFVMPIRTYDRYPYSAISTRPVYDWPGGKRLALYIALNLEWFSFGEGLGAEFPPGGPQPDVLNYAWRDYGNRVGIFRPADFRCRFWSMRKCTGTPLKRSRQSRARKSSVTAAAIRSAKAV